MSQTTARRGLILTSALGVVIVISGAAATAATATHHVRYYEENTSFTQTRRYVEFTDDDYVGSDASHAADYVATDHFRCVFGRGGGAPTCDGQIARGGSMLIVHGAGGQGTFTIPITGGTGTFTGAHGTLKVEDIGDTGDADLIVTYTL